MTRLPGKLGKIRSALFWAYVFVATFAGRCNVTTRDGGKWEFITGICGKVDACMASSTQCTAENGACDEKTVPGVVSGTLKICACFLKSPAGLSFPVDGINDFSFGGAEFDLSQRSLSEEITRLVLSGELAPDEADYLRLFAEGAFQSVSDEERKRWSVEPRKMDDYFTAYSLVADLFGNQRAYEIFALLASKLEVTSTGAGASSSWVEF